MAENKQKGPFKIVAYACEKQHLWNVNWSISVWIAAQRGPTGLSHVQRMQRAY